MFWTIGIRKSFMVISEERRKRLLIKIMVLHFSGAIEKKEEDRRFCKRSSELFKESIARSISELLENMTRSSAYTRHS
jgi:hypothetical protein